jgi:hypothetical protein
MHTYRGVHDLASLQQLTSEDTHDICAGLQAIKTRLECSIRHLNRRQSAEGDATYTPPGNVTHTYASSSSVKSSMERTRHRVLDEDIEYRMSRLTNSMHMRVCALDATVRWREMLARECKLTDELASGRDMWYGGGQNTTQTPTELRQTFISPNLSHGGTGLRRPYASGSPIFWSNLMSGSSVSGTPIWRNSSSASPACMETLTHDAIEQRYACVCVYVCTERLTLTHDVIEQRYACVCVCVCVSYVCVCMY